MLTKEKIIAAAHKPARARSLGEAYTTGQMADAMYIACWLTSRCPRMFEEGALRLLDASLALAMSFSEIEPDEWEDEEGWDFESAMELFCETALHDIICGRF